MNEHTCLVCGYSDDLEFQPRDYQICGCCGTEFNYDDRVLTHEQLRAEWVAKGYPWFDVGFGPPADWNPIQQLEKIGTRWLSAQTVVHANGIPVLLLERALAWTHPENWALLTLPQSNPAVARTDGRVAGHPRAPDDSSSLPSAAPHPARPEKEE